MKEQFKLVGHSYQIADTGDYDGCYEITNGRVSIFTKDEDEESLDEVVKALNLSDCEFYLNDDTQFENFMLKAEQAELNKHILLFAQWTALDLYTCDSAGMWYEYQNEDNPVTGEWLLNHWLHNIYYPSLANDKNIWLSP